jgi:hypothetical protein
MSTSTQSSLLKQVGHYGGERVTDSTVNGKFMAIHALTECVIGPATVGSISGFVGATLPLGDVIVGRWSSLEISGDAIVYYED